MIDIIGEIVRKDNVVESEREGKKVKRMEIHLEDLEEVLTPWNVILINFAIENVFLCIHVIFCRKDRLSCTLWGEFAVQMYSYLSDTNGGPIPIIVILQLCRVKIFNGDQTYIYALN